jgi:hypothetical protein
MISASLASKTNKMHAYGLQLCVLGEKAVFLYRVKTTECIYSLLLRQVNYLPLLRRAVLLNLFCATIESVFASHFYRSLLFLGGRETQSTPVIWDELLSKSVSWSLGLTAFHLRSCFIPR